MTTSERDLLTQMNPPQPTPLPWMAEKIVPSGALPLRGATPGRLLRVVAKEGHVNDWAAYCHYADEHDAESVARHGDKLFLDEAVVVFPFLVAARYRP